MLPAPVERYHRSMLKVGRAFLVLVCASAGVGSGATGCADDEPVTPADTGSTGGTEDSGTTSSPQTSTSTGSTGEGTTMVADSTGTTGLEDTTADTGMTGSSSESTGEPNLPPEAIDDLYFVREDAAPLVVDAAAGVLANDLDPEGEALSVDSSDAMSVGGATVTVQADGSFDYVPAPGFVGDDSFAYSVIDGAGQTAPGLVRVSVGPVSVSVGDLASGPGGLVIDGVAADDESGSWVAGGGDVDGDGLDDLVVTSPLVAGGAGRAWVVFGTVGGGGPIELADVSAGTGGFVIEGEAAGDGAGISADIVGDVDGDGLADVLVGAPGAGTAGRAYLVLGKADTASVALADVAMGIGGFVLDGDGTGEDAGTAVAGAGDVNGDGLADLVVGAPEGGPIPAGGRTYVVFGKSDTMPVALADVYLGVGGFVIRGAGFDDNSGSTVAGAGDVDGDGLADVLVGAQLANPGGLGNAGRCYVVFGRADTSQIDVATLGSGGFYIDGVEALDEACSAIAGLGDMNGDGLADVAVGAPADEDDLVLQGRTYVVFGKADSATVALADVAMGVGGFVVNGEAVGDFLGLAVGGPGDFDGDGYADLGLGTANVDLPGVFAGRGYVVLGKSDGAALPLTELTNRLGGFPLLAESANDELGWAAAGAGDVDGDGFGDLVISARRANPPPGVDAGRTYVVFGGNVSGSLTHLGDDGDDVIVGGPGLDVIVAGAGADELHGEGGSDILYGGAGDDLIGVRSGQFFRVRGGSGYDTLAFEDGGTQLDLGVINDAALRDIEAIDITGTGDNVLDVELRDLRAMVGPSHTLRVMGDASDTLEVDLSGGGFVDEGVVAGVHTWSNGVLVLEVVEPLVPMVLL